MNINIKTRCPVPCLVYEYNMSPFASQSIEYLNDMSTDYLKTINEPNGSIIVLGHNQAPQIKIFREDFKYTAMSFIGDVGGIVGIFIGLSFWSIYSDLISPFLSKMFTFLYSKLSAKFWNKMWETTIKKLTTRHVIGTLDILLISLLWVLVSSCLFLMYHLFPTQIQITYN